MCQSPLGTSRQKKTYGILWIHTLRKKHVINSLRFPAVATCYTILEVAVSEFSPAGALDMTTHTCGVLISSFETLYTYMCPTFLTNTTYFLECLSAFSWFPSYVRPILMVSGGTKRTDFRHTACLTINFSFGHSCHLTKLRSLGVEIFRTLYGILKRYYTFCQ
jgi:hypothetical protein